MNTLSLCNRYVEGYSQLKPENVKYSIAFQHALSCKFMFKLSNQIVIPYVFHVLYVVIVGSRVDQ